MRTPEGREKKIVREFLDEVGAFHRWPVPYGYGQPDVDCHACIGGTFWLIEVKAEGQHPTALQWLTLRKGEEAGARIAWGTAVDICRVIDHWLIRQAHGGPVDYRETDPHALCNQKRAQK